MHVSRNRSPAMRLPYRSQAQEVLPSQAKVVGGVKIGKGGVVTMRTMKMKTIPGTRLATSGAEPRAVGGIYPDDRYPSLHCLVGNKALKSGESPVVVKIPLALSHLRPLPDVGQVFEGDGIAQTPCLLNDSPAYVMKHPVQDTVFPSANGFDAPMGRAGALCLKLLSHIGIMSPYILGLLALEVKSRGAGCQVTPADINPDNPDWLDSINFLLNNKAEVNPALPHIQDNLGFPVPPICILLVVIALVDGQIQPAPDNGNGCPILLYLECGAVEMKRAAVEIDKLPTPFWIPVSPADLPYCLADQSCRERACCPDSAVGSVVEPVSAESLRAEGDVGDIVQGLVVSLKGAEQNGPVLRRGFEFEFQGFPSQHMSILAY